MENNAASLQLTESAALRIKKVMSEQNNPNLLIRLEVLGGGCSGYQYKFKFDTLVNEVEDIVIKRNGASLVVDKTSLELLKGSEVDYGESIVESGFRVQNPNAVSTCGCGTSFAVGKE